MWNGENKKIHKQGKNGTFHIPYFYTVDFSKYKKRDPASTQRLRKAMGVEHADTSAVKEYPDMIEDLLGESENEAANVIHKLLSHEPIDDHDRIELATFMGFMYVRTPAFRQWSEGLEVLMHDRLIKDIFSSKEKVTKMYEKMRSEGYDKDVDVDAILEVVKDERYKIKIPKERLIQSMLAAVPVIDQILFKMTWFIIQAEEGGFVTTDTPVFLLRPEQGFEAENNQVFFPLSKFLLLVMEKTERGRKTLLIGEKKDEVDRLNGLIASRRNNYVIATNEEVLTKDILD